MAATASSSRRSESIGVSTLFNQSPPQPPSSPDPDPTIHPADPRRCAAFPSFSRKLKLAFLNIPRRFVVLKKRRKSCIYCL
jgi:hypothetical protein